MAGGAQLTDVLRTQFRILTFRFTEQDLQGFDRRHLALGLMTAWLAGVGRYWDHPDPYVLQRLGVGSLLIPIVLSAVLFALLHPLRPQRWSYTHLLTFVSLTSLPAFLYAIPVERFLDLPVARTVNVWFLAIVAVWRVALLGTYLRRSSRLPIAVTAIALLLPLALIVATLAVLNLERAVFDLMSGMREEGTSNDAAYGVLLVLTTYSLIGSPVLLLGYFGAIFFRQRQPRVVKEHAV